MLFNTFIASVVLLAVQFATSVQAVPTIANQPNEFGLIITNTQELADGITVTVWGEAEGYLPPTPSNLTARDCGTNDITCDTGHVPSTGSCAQLINILNQNSGTVLGDSPRSICVSQNGSQCCVSWSAVVHGLHEGSLVSAAQELQDTCVTPR